jgi:hypothetical protein
MTGYTDSSLVAVKINLAGYNANVAGLQFELNYDASVVLENVEITDTRFAVQEYKNSVAANGSGKVSFAFLNTVATPITAKAEVATLYFRINSDTATSAAFTFSGITFPTMAMFSLPRILSHIFPFTYFSDIFIDEVMYGAPTRFVIWRFIPLIAFTLLAPISWHRLQRITTIKVYWGRD